MHFSFQYSQSGFGVFRWRGVTDNQTKDVNSYCTLRYRNGSIAENIFGDGDLQATTPKQTAMKATVIKKAEFGNSATKTTNEGALIDYLRTKTFRA